MKEFRGPFLRDILTEKATNLRRNLPAYPSDPPCTAYNILPNAWVCRTPGCVCVCVFFPSILDIKFVGRTSRGHTGGRSHRIFNPPSFCGACLDFCRVGGVFLHHLLHVQKQPGKRRNRVAVDGSSNDAEHRDS